MSKRKKKRQKRLIEVADQLLEKLGQAVEELDQQVVTEVHKEKEVFYENEDSPKKATRETVRETETLKKVDSLVDRAGLKQLIAALKDIQEVQQLDENGGSQEAVSDAMQVILSGEVGEYAG